jgi:hypothetical protein
LSSTLVDPDVPNPSSLALAALDGNLLEFYAGTTGREAATLLSFAIPRETNGPATSPQAGSLGAFLGPDALSGGSEERLPQVTGSRQLALLIPLGESPLVSAYIDRYVALAQARSPQLAAATAAWWLEERPFFGGLMRQRIWTFWRRVLHTCHHRTQVQTWLRLAGQPAPAIYGPSGDVTWEEADPTDSVEAAERGA